MSEEITRLTTVWDLRLDKFEEKLNKVVRAAYGSAEKVEKRLDAANSNISTIFGKPGQAFDKMFDATRLKVLDSGIARVGIYGSSLEKLGVVGLGAAAAIGAVAFALSQAGEALKFADELEDTAGRLHVTTDALQEYRYAIRAAGGDEKGADEALGNFSATLGKAQAGLPKAIRAFKELGFTKEQIKGFSDTQSALDAVIGKISALGSTAQKDAVVQQLGLQGIQQLAEGGVEQMKRLREEAHKAGVVFSSDLIVKASGLHDQIETINQRISVDMKSAFISLGPVIVGLKTGLADMLESVLHIIDAFRQLPNRSDLTLRKQLIDNQNARADLDQGRGVSIIPGIHGLVTIPLSAAQQKAERDRLDQQDSEINNELTRREQGAQARNVWDFKAMNLGSGSLVDQSKAAGGPSAASQLKHFDEQLAKAAEQILAAMDDDLHSLQERQAIARQRLEAEDGARRTAIADEVQTKAITAKQGEVLLAKQDEVTAAKRAQLNDQQAQALSALALKQEQDLYGAVAAMLDAQLGLTHSAEERAALEAQILVANRTILRKALVQAQADDPDKSPAHQAQLAVGLSAFDATTGLLQKGQNAKSRDDVAAERLSISQAGLDAEIDALQVSDQLAETAAARRDNELKLLDLQDRKLRAEYEATIASETASKTDKAIAKIKLDSLNATAAGRQQGVVNGTRGPFEQFRAGLPLDPDKLNDAFENVASHGLASLEDGLVGVIGHTKKLGDVFREVATQIIADLARIEIERAIIGPLEAAVAGSGGGPLAFLGNLFGGGRASGGPVSPGKFYRVNESGQEYFAPSVPGVIVPQGAMHAAAGVRGQAPSITVISPVHVHAEGGVGFREFVGAINSQIDRSHGRAIDTALNLARKGGPAALAAYQQHAGG